VKKIILLKVVLCLFASCDYTQKIQKETKEKIVAHKDFIRNFSFDGVVYEKKNCEGCKFNRYQIIIILNDIDVNEIELKNRSFPPYYSTFSDNKLNLSVNKKVCDIIQVEKKIVKIKNSSTIIFNKKEYCILSDLKYRWIPNGKDRNLK